MGEDLEAAWVEKWGLGSGMLRTTDLNWLFSFFLGAGGRGRWKLVQGATENQSVLCRKYCLVDIRECTRYRPLSVSETGNLASSPVYSLMSTFLLPKCLWTFHPLSASFFIFLLIVVVQLPWKSFQLRFQRLTASNLNWIYPLRSTDGIMKPPAQDPILAIVVNAETFACWMTCI